MSYDEDHIAMAAEYVLGTLDGDERAQVETMMTVDPEFKLVVEQWERRLGELHAMVGAVEPADEVWGKIRTAVAAIAPESAMRLPEVTSVPAAVAPPVVQEIAPTAARSSRCPDRGRRWRSLAQLTTALAACLGGVHRRAGLSAGSVAGAVAAAGQDRNRAGAARGAVRRRVAARRRLAGLHHDDRHRTKEFTVRKAGADAPAGRSYELWMVSDRFTQPRSLGVIGATDFTTKAVLASFDNATIHAATYAVTVEPEGGSPTGAPTSAPIYAGKLIETVPAASTPPPAKR